ncbi:MAG: adenylyltransferase/cytidyltransferase family protein [bacterium]
MTTPRKKIVLAFGTFDYVHPGHKYYLEQARKLGEALVVVVARDSTVKEAKRAFPIRDEETRLTAVKRLRPVTRATLGSESDYYRVLDIYRPEVIALGYDQKFLTRNLKRELKRRRLRTNIVRIDAYKPEQFKSSIIRGAENKISRRNNK